MNNLVPQKFRKKSRITESIQKPLWVSASVSFQRVDRVGRNNSSTFQKNISLYLHDAHLLGTYCVKKKKKKNYVTYLLSNMREKEKEQGSDKIWNKHGNTKPEDSK